MFGLNMRVEYDGFGVNLVPISKKDLPEIVANFNSLKIHMYTKGLFAQTLENEEEWYEKNRKDKDSCVWGIVPDGSKKVVGVTSLHAIDLFGSCVSGIVIWNSSWWKKGVATRAHLGRTLFAADYLNRFTIKSGVRVENFGSLNALLRVGYNVIGVEPRTFLRAGKFLDTYGLCWLNPDKIPVLFPEGLPDIYKDGVEKAKTALEKARKVTTFP